MQTIRLGAVELTRVLEWQGPFAPAATMVPDAAPEDWQRLPLGFWQDGMYVAALQTWVLRSEGRTILVDTGIGDVRLPQETRPRAVLPALLADVGVRPDDVDVVVNTHLHYDHVGWNTVAGGHGRVPTFPRATYLIPAADESARRTSTADDRMSYADAVAPIVAAGQAVLWHGRHRIDGNLALESAPGHTPGSSVLRLASGTDRAVFVGDLLHSPVQIGHPEHNSCFDEDPGGARRSRIRALARAADERELVIPAHFAGAGAAQVRRDGDHFTISSWAGGL
jgi:glyoxylase-like metal-dependent hydrolase (beta-lactamase superfamily II)